MADKKKLERLLRVRTLQLGLVRADEAQAQARVASEANLRARIAQLADGVSPAPSPTPTAGVSLVAAAHFRERLHHSAEAAEGRVRAAQAVAFRAAEATREAKRDQSAIEKLIDRAATEAALKEIRKLEAMPPSRKIRHDPC
jgi:flagellar FliJ protein